MARVLFVTLFAISIIVVESEYGSFMPNLDSFASFADSGLGPPVSGAAVIQGDGHHHIHGVLYFHQASSFSPLVIRGEVHGLTPGKHGMHVHDEGDLTHGCDGAGDHYNPLNKHHGGPEDPDRHIGDLGNIVADIHGTAKIYKADRHMTLGGKFNILNKVMVIHANPDDLGRGGDVESKETGNSGGRIACGVIFKQH